MAVLDDILRRAHGQAERRSTLRAPDQLLTDAMVGPYASGSGVSVSPDAALRHADAYACIRVYSDAAASLPLVVYRRTDGGRDRAPDAYAARLLRRPSPTMTQAAMLGTVMAHLQGWGNAFIAKYRVGGELVQLGVIHPARVSVDVVAGEPRFHVQPDGAGKGADGVFNRRDIIHVKGMSLDGVVGLSPISQAREAIGVGISLQDAAAKLLRNDSRPGGVLASDKRLSDPVIKRLKESWEALLRGDNRGRVAVLEEGLTYQPITLSPSDAQFIEQMKYSATQIARAFRLPPHMIGAESGGSMTYSNMEQENMAFVTHSLRPWLVAIEQAFAGDHDLFDEDGATYPEFLMDAFFRADLKSRFEAYAIAVDKFMTRNEIRRRENLNDTDGGDDLGGGGGGNSTAVGAQNQEEAQ